MVHVSWSPRVFLLKGFMTDAECDYLINQVCVGGVGGGSGVVSSRACNTTVPPWLADNSVHACGASTSATVALVGGARDGPLPGWAGASTFSTCIATRMPRRLLLLLLLLLQAKSRMRAVVVSGPNGTWVVSDIRTSTGMFFNWAENEVVARIERRAAQVSGGHAGGQTGS